MKFFARITWCGTTSASFSKPEQRKLGEDASLVGNRRGKDDVEGRKAVGRDDQQAIAAELIDVADLSASAEFESGEICLRNNCIHLRRSHELVSPVWEGGILAQGEELSTAKKKRIEFRRR